MTLVEVLKEARLPYAEEGRHHHARPGWVQLRECPWCGSQAYHLGISLRSLACACWRCGRQSTYATLLKLGVDPALVRVALAGRSFARPELKAKRPLRELAPRTELKSAHRQYLKARGLNPEEIARCWSVEAWKWRLYIPVICEGQRQSFTTRAIVDAGVQRYLSANVEEYGGTNIKELLYGFDNCYQSAVIVEGPLDAWAVGPGAVATFGTAFTPAQVEQLTCIPYRYICFDSEPQAQKKAVELAQALSLFPGVTSHIILDAKDPAEASRRELQQVRQIAGLQ